MLILDDEDLATNVYAMASPSIVSIVNLGSSKSPVDNSYGSGVIWDEDHLVTNYHVISRVDKSELPKLTKALISDEAGRVTSYDLALSGTDAAHDLAVLQIMGPSVQEDQPPTKLSAAKVSRSSTLRVGTYAFAIGNPEGRGKTFTAGVVSGLDRSIPSPVGTRIYGVVQTDAMINAGNSGGGLFDSSGSLIGLCTALFTRSGSGKGSGVNFALPSDLLLEVVPNLIKFGNASGKKV